MTTALLLVWVGFLCDLPTLYLEIASLNLALRFIKLLFDK